VVGKKGVMLFIQLHRIFLSCFGEKGFGQSSISFQGDCQ